MSSRPRSMHHFCTYCDRGYAARALCLFQSLKRQGEPFRLFVLCFDAETEAAVRAQADARLVAVPLSDLLAADPELAATRPLRSKVEFFFTSTPCVVRHCLRAAPEAGSMTYLDADLAFFAPPSVVFAEQGDASVGIVPHRHPEHRTDLLAFGRYNVGWVFFARDADGLACLDWWRERCLDWCHDHVEDGRFADQRYLDDFPKRFRGVKEISHPGANLAPWNVGAGSLGEADGRPTIDGRPVLFYHYQGVREARPGWFDPGLKGWALKPAGLLRERIYLPYLRELQETQTRAGLTPVYGYRRLPAAGWQRFKEQHLVGWVRRVRGELIILKSGPTAPEPGA